VASNQGQMGEMVQRELATYFPIISFSFPFPWTISPTDTPPSPGLECNKSTFSIRPVSRHPVTTPFIILRALTATWVSRSGHANHTCLYVHPSPTVPDSRLQTPSPRNVFVDIVKHRNSAVARLQTSSKSMLSFSYGVRVLHE